MESVLGSIVSVFIAYNTFNPTSRSFDCFAQINMQGDVNDSVVDNFKHSCVSGRNAAIEPLVSSWTCQRALREPLLCWCLEQTNIDPVLMSWWPELSLCFSSAFHITPTLFYPAGEDQRGTDGTHVQPKTRREPSGGSKFTASAARKLEPCQRLRASHTVWIKTKLPGMFAVQRNNW